VTADSWARTILQVLQTRYPYAAGHATQSADDLDVRPDRRHPGFYGSYDWHSSAHMQWSAVRLLDRPGLDPDLRQGLVAELDSRQTPANGAV